MAIDILIKKGDQCLKDKDYLEAINVFSQAIKENQQAFQPYIKRASAWHKLANYEAAKKDISIAYNIAQNRGKRSEIGACYFRLGLVYYSEKKYKSALTHFEKAKTYDCQENTLSVWKSKCEYDIRSGKGEESEEEDIETETEKKSPQPQSSDPQVINQHAPIKPKIKDDWYQTKDAVTITIYAKNVSADSLSVQFDVNSVSVSFPSADNSEYNYLLDPLGGEIDPAKCSHRIFGTKIEIYLTKKTPGNWPSLEKSAVEESASLSYPSSSKKSINWANFKVDDDEDDSQTNEASFFEKLYKDTDDDTRRAMMKSYVQSNGTVLTTNWEDAKAKDFETSPPEGMEAKKWN